MALSGYIGDLVALVGSVVGDVMALVGSVVRDVMALGESVRGLVALVDGRTSLAGDGDGTARVADALVCGDQVEFGILCAALAGGAAIDDDSVGSEPVARRGRQGPTKALEAFLRDRTGRGDLVDNIGSLGVVRVEGWVLLVNDEALPGMDNPAAVTSVAAADARRIGRAYVWGLGDGGDRARLGVVSDSDELSSAAVPRDRVSATVRLVEDASVGDSEHRDG